MQNNTKVPLKTHSGGAVRRVRVCLTLGCDGSLEEALGDGEQGPVGVQGVDGGRGLQQLGVGVHLRDLGDGERSVALLA